jgi:hypothetical protein
MSEHTLTRRALLQGAAVVTAAVVLPLPALAAEYVGVNTEVVVNASGEVATNSLPTTYTARATVDLDSLTEAEHETALAFCGLAGVLMTDDEATAALAAAYYAMETDPELDFDGLLTAVDGERLMLGLRDRCATEERLHPTDERRMAGVLVGLGFVRGMPSDLFDLVHARRLEELPDLFAA